MLINSVPMDVVGDAYRIAVNYLGKTGLMPATPEIHQPLLDAVIQEFRAGTHNKIKLANRAIARIEKAADAMELI
jgi:hypothetical protein